MPEELQVIDLACERGDRLVLRQVQFCLAAGQVLYVRGANGSGKTTLLRILAGLLPWLQGDVVWQGHSILRQRQAYYRDMAYVGHQHSLKLSLTVHENLCLDALLMGKTAATVMTAALQRMSLQPYQDVLCSKLSVGQQRRVALARLLLGKQRLWIVDEPYNGLDQAHCDILQEIFIDHVTNGGMLIITSHQPLTLPALTVHSLELDAAA